MALIYVMIAVLLDGGALLAGYYQCEKGAFAQSQHLAVLASVHLRYCDTDIRHLGHSVNAGLATCPQRWLSA
jgi:hypothetical protein